MVQHTERYCVVEVTPQGKFVAVISGMGRNKGTWDASTDSRRTAQRWAAQLRREYPDSRFRVEPN